MKVSEEENIELKINENVEENDGLKELTRLTAEFESFMKTSKDDIVETNENPESKELTIVETSDVRDVDENFNNLRKKSPEKVVMETIEVDEKESPIFEKVTSTFHYQNNVRPEVNVAPQRLEPDVEYLPSSSREETPDYIPVPVREKFHALRIDENEMNGDAMKHKSRNDVKRSEEVPPVNINTVKVPHEIVESSTKTALENPLKAQQNGQVVTETVEENVYATPVAARRRHEIVQKSPTVAKRTHVVQVTPGPEVSQRTSSIARPEVAIEPEVIIISSSSNHVVTTAQLDEQPMRVTNGKREEEKVSSSLTVSQTVTRTREETPIPIAATETVTRDEKPIQFFEDIETFIRKKENQNDDDIYDPEDPPKPPERRRSVKDIIESINRSQQLLRTSTPQFEKKYNFNSQKFSYHERPVVPPKPNALLKFQRQAESERKINELLADLQDFSKNNHESAKAPKFPYDSSEDVANNNIASERTGSFEFNPIPKPKRSLDNS